MGRLSAMASASSSQQGAVPDSDGPAQAGRPGNLDNTLLPQSGAAQDLAIASATVPAADEGSARGSNEPFQAGAMPDLLLGWADSDMGLLEPPPQKRRRGRPKKAATSAAAEEPAAPSLLSTLIDNRAFWGPAEQDVVAQPQPAAPADASALTVGATASLSPGPQGFFPMAQTGPALAACILQSQRGAGDLDPDYLKLFDRFVGSTSLHSASLTVASGALDLSRWVMQEKVSRLASALYQHEKHQRTSLETSITKALGPSRNLKVYVDAARHDETLMKGSMRAGSARDVPASSALAVGSGESQVSADAVFLQTLESQLTTTAVSLKVLQCQSSFAMLIQVGQQHCTIVGQSATPLQIVERTTAEVMRETLLRLSSASVSSLEFPFRTRVACTDAAGSNFRAEKAIAQERTFASLHWTCDVHRTATSYSKTFDSLMGAHVAGMIHTALALQQAGGIALFRLCLKEEIRKRLKVMKGVPPPAARVYKEGVLRLFLSSQTSGAMVQRVLLARTCE